MTSSRIPASVVLSLVLAACVAKSPENLGELESSSSGESESDPTSSASGMSASGMSASGMSASTEPTDTATSEPATTAVPTTDDSGGTTETESETQGETGEPLVCEGEEVEHFPAGCPDTQAGIQLPAQGCYEECTGEGDTCATGRCTLVLVDPCPCADDPMLCCDACAGQQWLCVDEAVLGDCGLVVDRTFSSLEELECGIGPKGEELCNWTVEFRLDGTFSWLHSDVGEVGTFACVDGTITITDGPMVDVAYDADADILVWDGVQYQ